MMHFARIEKSKRLQRLLAFLREKGDAGCTTMEIIQGARVVGVNGAAKELRMNGYTVECGMERSALSEDGVSSVYRYRLREAA